MKNLFYTVSYSLFAFSFLSFSSVAKLHHGHPDEHPQFHHGRPDEHDGK